MTIVIDLIILAIVLVCVLIYAKRGFVKSVFGVVGFIAAIVLAFILSTPLSNFTYEKAIEPTVTTAIEKTLSDEVANSTQALTDSVFDALPSFIKNNIDESSFSNINILDVDTTHSFAERICEDIIKPTAVSVLKVIFSLILFVVLSFVIKFLVKFLNKVFSFSIIGKLNTTLGAALGVIIGVIVAMVFVLAVNLIMSFSGGFFFFTPDNIGGTILFKFIIDSLRISI